MKDVSLADELGDVRDQIGALRMREAALLAQVLERSGNVPDGQFSRVEVVTHLSWVIDREALPPEIVNNPRFWREKVTTLVRSVPTAPVHGNARIALGI